MSSNPTTHDEKLARLFEGSDLEYDFEKGTIHNRTDNRIIWLSSDIVKGIFRALDEEAGEARGLIMKNCGRVWGRSVVKTLDRELASQGHEGQGELSVQNFIALLRAFFSKTGWGLIDVDLSKASPHGYIEVLLKNSFFSHVMNELSGTVDHLLAGVFEVVFSNISGQDLMCLEIASVNTGEKVGRFLLSARSRIEEIEEWVEEGRSPEAIVAKLETP